MNLLKPRSKKKFLEALKGVKVSDPAKSIIAEICAEVESIAYTSINELRANVLTVLLSVAEELHEHDVEYQHVTSPEVKEAVHKAIVSLGGKAK